MEQICGPGVDPAFDQLIVALGHVARPKPKALIDSMMLWRKAKSDVAGEARQALQQAKSLFPSGQLPRRNTEPVQAHMQGPSGDVALANGALSPKLADLQENVFQTERKSIASIYVLCRVLLEILSQTTLSSLTVDMEDKLEGIIFGQLKSVEMEVLLSSPLRLGNWNLFAQILGAMSELSFTTVTGRFLAELEQLLQELEAKSPTSFNTVESRVEIILSGMKHLQLKTSPPEAWSQSCDFMISIGKLFTKAHGPKAKSAFCQAIDMLLLPIAAKASSSNLSHAKWAEVLSTISPRLAQMMSKPRHWSAAFPLTATMLCVSPPETFASQWLQLVLPLQSRMKDRITKPLCLQVISRLLWTYLYRAVDNPSSATRKLDEVVKLVLPMAKRGFIATEPSVAEPLIQIIRAIGSKYPEYCFKTIIFPLINAGLFSSNKDLKVEQLEPDKMVIGIRAFLAIISDLEKGEKGRPPFPQYYAAASSPERFPTSPAFGSLQGTPTSPTVPLQSQPESSSRPVATGALTDTVREYYNRFCEILGKITIICDNTFGGQAALDEKFNSPGPKTPITDTFNFARRDDHQAQADQKQAFYDLLHVAVQALPRCLSADIPFNSLINLLCTGTAHVQPNIAESSAQSLKAIARQSHAQQVTMGFARFIFNFDDRYSTMSDGGMLGAGHIESTLRLYVELLHIWIDEIKQKTKEAQADQNDHGLKEKRAMKLDLSSIWAEVDQVEAHGLFFLCSQSRRVRRFAVTVLKLITEFDTALGKDGTRDKALRLIDIFENDSMQIMNFKDDHLSVAERSRLQRGMQNGNKRGALIELCTSDVSYDTTLWFKIFPNLVKIAFEKCVLTVTICRELICNRIQQMYKAVVMQAEPRGQYFSPDSATTRFTPGRTPTTQPEALVDQWKLYLIFACTTIAESGSTPAGPQGNQHGRKGSKSNSSDKIVSARTLFRYLIPLLSAGSQAVREAVVVGMGSINVNIYRTLLEELQSQVARCSDEARQRLHQRSNSNSSPKRSRKIDLLRTEITHVYKLTSHFLKDERIYTDEYIMNNLVAYTKDLKIFLMDYEVQMDWEFQKLRRHYCGLMEELFEGINRTRDPSRWMTFEARKSAFALMEEWCGFSPNQNQIRQREDSMRQSMIDQQAVSERGTVTAAMEIEKRNLRTAALSAMAALCAGPIAVTTDSGATLAFDPRRMLAWIEAIFNSGSDRMKHIGRRALKNVILHNQDYAGLLDHCVSRCYLTDNGKVLESYFEVINEVLIERPDYPSPLWKLIGLCMFTLGSDQSEIRTKSAQLLRTLEERQPSPRNSKIQDFDISISDKTKAVYKLAQFEISKRLAKQYPELAFHIFSDFTLNFKDVQPGSQRNVVAIMLPWIQSVELKLDPNGGPTTESYVLLANLIEITIKTSGAMHNEVQALWQALATGPFPQNVRIVLDFIISLCLDRREQNFVEYAKQIVVFLASTNSGPGNDVVEFLLSQVNPKAMVPNEKREPVAPPLDTSMFPYCADLAEALPIGTKQAGFSLGQLGVVLLVDLMVSQVHLTNENVPVLVQAAVVLWDHYTPLVQEQAREMLVHLIHESVISKLPDGTPTSTKRAIEELIDSIRRHDRLVVWDYDDYSGKNDAQGNNLPPSMERLTADILKTFELTLPGIREQWAKLSLTWATACPVRHIACRSFQIFRCVLTSLDQVMLGDMLVRLSNTIADEDSEIQTFSMEILTTLKTLISKLDLEMLSTLPQLFWTTCATLESINEREFLEAVEMLNEYLRRLDFSAPSTQRMLLDGQPSRWEGDFDGLQPLLYKGLRSSNAFEPTLRTLDALIKLPSHKLVGDESRLFFTCVANLPQFLQDMEQGRPSPGVMHTAQLLIAVAEAEGYSGIARVLDRYVASKYRSSKDFAEDMYSALREHFLPQLDFPMIMMLMGMLTNSIPWVRIQTMRILKIVIPETDMRKPEFSGHGTDLVSPLLRLLQTEFCMEALDVLEGVMSLPSTAMDRQHVRMSMTRATAAKTSKKEFERVNTLFGLPDASGWAIPLPAKKTERTRANVHACFYMCQIEGAGGVPSEPTPTPEVAFHADEFPYSYFNLPDRTDTMMSDDIRGDGHMGDLITKLDSLDDFFDDLSHPITTDAQTSRSITEYHPESFDSGAKLYDEKILPILHQASGGGASMPNGFAERPTVATTHLRNLALTSANASTTQLVPPPPPQPPVANGPQQHSSRQGMHSRSVTMPVNTGHQHHHQYHQTMPQSEFSDDDDDEVFSDADDERPGTRGAGGTADDSSLLENMIKPIKESTRPRVRRLTGGRTRESDRQRDAFRAELQQASPSVPKVPNVYLAKPQTPNDV